MDIDTMSSSSSINTLGHIDTISSSSISNYDFYYSDLEEIRYDKTKPKFNFNKANYYLFRIAKNPQFRSNLIYKYIETLLNKTIKPEDKDEYETIIYDKIKELIKPNSKIYKIIDFSLLKYLFRQALICGYLSLCVLVIHKNIYIPANYIYSMYLSVYAQNYKKMLDKKERNIDLLVIQYELASQFERASQYERASQFERVSRNIYNLLIYVINYYKTRITFKDISIKSLLDQNNFCCGDFEPVFHNSFYKKLNAVSENENANSASSECRSIITDDSASANVGNLASSTSLSAIDNSIDFACHNKNLFNRLMRSVILNNDSRIFNLIVPFYYAKAKTNSYGSICSCGYKISDHVKRIKNNICITMYNLCRFCFLKMYKKSEHFGDHNLTYIISANHIEILDLILDNLDKNRLYNLDYEIVNYSSSFEMVHYYYNRRYIETYNVADANYSENAKKTLNVIFLASLLEKNLSYGDQLLKICLIYERKFVIYIYFNLIINHKLFPSYAYNKLTRTPQIEKINFLLANKKINDANLQTEKIVNVLMENVRLLPFNYQYEIIFNLVKGDKKRLNIELSIIDCVLSNIILNKQVMKLFVRECEIVDNYGRLKLLLEKTQNVFDVYLHKHVVIELLNIGLDPNILINCKYTESESANNHFIANLENIIYKRKKYIEGLNKVLGSLFVVNYIIESYISY
jgi:hypothetical protein